MPTAHQSSPKNSSKFISSDRNGFRTIIEKSLDAVILYGADGAVQYATPSSARLMGYEPDELNGTDGFERVHPADRGWVREVYATGLREPDATLTATYRVRHKDGSWRWLEARASNLLHEPSVGAVVVTFRDVTTQRETEAALREREELLRSIIAHIPCGVFWKDHRSVFLGCNEQFARDHGFMCPEDVVGRTDAELPFARAEADEFRACDQVVMDTGEPVLHLEETQTRPAGGQRTMLTSKVPLRNPAGEVIGVLGVYQDISELKRLEDQCRQAQKMEAVGQLAGGVAHDFNNLLTVINGCSEIARSALRDHDPVRPLLEEVGRAGERAADLTRQLLAFSRKQMLQPRLLELNGVVGNISRMLRRLIGEDVELALKPGPGLRRVKADPGQLEQVLMNLSVNARDAMPTGGRITIETRNVELAGGVRHDGSEVRPGAYVLLAVSDTGIGMTQEVLDHIFEPFFTTKGLGRGTGLGLATVYGVVAQSGGHIEVDTAVGRGTTFRLYFPAAEGEPAGAETADGVALPRGSETVLVVEDEAGVRELVRLQLEQLGYEVLAAVDAEHALAVARRSDRPVRLLLTDVVMPGAGGQILSEWLRVVSPDLRVLFMSGYTDDTVIRHGVEANQVNFLQKPFSPAALARKVREVLDAPG